MQLARETLTATSAVGPVPVVCARPARVSAPLPGLLVIQEAWGVDEHIQDLVDRLAAAGYHAAAPDLYAVGGARPPALTVERLGELRRFVDDAGAAVFRDPELRAKMLANKPDEIRTRLGETFAALPFSQPQLHERSVEALVASARLLREGPSRGRKVGAVGFCMGGMLAGRLSTKDPELGAAVMFYGGPPALDAIGAIRAPLLGLYADPKLDPLTHQVAAFEKAMREAGKPFESRIFEGAAHGFLNDLRTAYHPEASRSAWALALGFLDRHLGA